MGLREEEVEICTAERGRYMQWNTVKWHVVEWSVVWNGMKSLTELKRHKTGRMVTDEVQW